MSKYRRIAFFIIGIELLTGVLFNVWYLTAVGDRDIREYRVEAERIARRLQDEPVEDIDLSEYRTIVKVSELRADEACSRDYVVEEVDGVWYRMEYIVPGNGFPLICMNLAMLVMLLLSASVLFYVGVKILKPFHRMNRLSVELAKGNLSAPLQKEKTNFFGDFLWGLDMLREDLEEKKQKELELQREKKTLILSLSHDIKTPLSAIELYTKALSEHLYDTEEQQGEALHGILKNADEIKRYVNEITQASREDFLNLEAKEGEFYLSEVMNLIESHYRDKLSAIHTEFAVERVDDSILKGDKDRVVEVLQNLMENAVKYGDGKRIHIRFDEEEDCKLIRIENTGSRIEPEELPHLFDSFYRGSNSRNVKGSGLGLYICRNLMRKMGGEVFARMKGDVFQAVVVIGKA